MDLDLAGKRALVTGASRGIGKAIAERLAAEGCNLYLTARAMGPLEAARKDLRARWPVEIEVHACDLMQRGSPAALAERFGDADILINNAGATPTGPIEE